MSENIAVVNDMLIAMFSIWQHFTLLDCIGRVCRCWHIMTTLFSKSITGNEATLVKLIDVDGLWIELQARRIITEQQLANCRSQVSHLSISETARAFYIFISTVPGVAKNSPIKPCFFVFSAVLQILCCTFYTLLWVQWLIWILHGASDIPKTSI